MNTKRVMIVGAVVLVALLAVAALAYAQGVAQSTPPGFGYGPGLMSGRSAMRGPMMRYGQPITGTMPYGRSMMGGIGMMAGGGYGPMRDAMHTALAEALDLTREQLDERIADGETPHEIALAQGLTDEQFFQLMQTARQTAVEQRVADGMLTQEQADWMLSHMSGRGMMRGNFADCPYYDAAPTPTQP